MANAIFTSKVTPAYDDLPEERYHFPSTYLKVAQQAVGDWILYYEPRRSDATDSSTGGRQAYFATARVRAIEPDPNTPAHYYAYMRDYVEFVTPVPFKTVSGHYWEGRLQKGDGSTNKGLFGRAIRQIEPHEYKTIVMLGLNAAPVVQPEMLEDRLAMVAEEPTPYAAIRPTQLLERPMRDQAFTRLIQKAYESTCCMTGLKLINGGGKCEIEAAHIRPVSADGPDSARNGLALSRTVHWMFDRGILSIGDRGEILTAKKLVPDQVRRMLNPEQRIILPNDQTAVPHPTFLKYHREHIFKGD